MLSRILQRRARRRAPAAWRPVIPAILLVLGASLGSAQQGAGLAEWYSYLPSGEARKAGELVERIGELERSLAERAEEARQTVETILADRRETQRREARARWEAEAAGGGAGETPPGPTVGPTTGSGGGPGAGPGEAAEEPAGERLTRFIRNHHWRRADTAASPGTAAPAEDRSDGDGTGNDETGDGQTGDGEAARGATAEADEPAESYAVLRRAYMDARDRLRSLVHASPPSPDSQAFPRAASYLMGLPQAHLLSREELTELRDELLGFVEDTSQVAVAHEYRRALDGRSAAEKSESIVVERFAMEQSVLAWWFELVSASYPQAQTLLDRQSNALRQIKAPERESVEALASRAERRRRAFDSLDSELPSALQTLGIPFVAQPRSSSEEERRAVGSVLSAVAGLRASYLSALVRQDPVLYGFLREAYELLSLAGAGQRYRVASAGNLSPAQLEAALSQAFRTAVRLRIDELELPFEEAMERRVDAVDSQALDRSNDRLSSLRSEGEKVVARLKRELDGAGADQVHWTSLSVLSNPYAQYLLSQAPQYEEVAGDFGRYLRELYENVDRRLAGELGEPVEELPLVPAAPETREPVVLPFDRQLISWREGETDGVDAAGDRPDGDVDAGPDEASDEDADGGPAGARDTTDIEAAYYAAFYHETQEQPEESYSPTVAAAWAASHGQSVVALRRERGEAPHRQPDVENEAEAEGEDGARLPGEDRPPEAGVAEDRLTALAGVWFARARDASDPSQAEMLALRGLLTLYGFLMHEFVGPLESYSYPFRLVAGARLSLTLDELGRLAEFEASVLAVESRLAEIWLRDRRERIPGRRDDIAEEIGRAVSATLGEARAGIMSTSSVLKGMTVAARIRAAAELTAPRERGEALKELVASIRMQAGEGLLLPADAERLAALARAARGETSDETGNGSGGGAGAGYGGADDL